MGIAPLVGFGIGWWLDGRFDTSPWLSLVGLLAGIGAAFKALVRLVRELDGGRNKTSDSKGRRDPDRSIEPDAKEQEHEHDR